MTDTLASLVQPGDTILGCFYDHANDRYHHCTVTEVNALDDGYVQIVYRYPSGATSHQCLRPWDRIPIPTDVDPLPTGPRTVGAG